MVGILAGRREVIKVGNIFELVLPYGQRDILKSIRVRKEANTIIMIILKIPCLLVQYINCYEVCVHSPESRCYEQHLK